jgi:hypothetical protein
MIPAAAGDGGVDSGYAWIEVVPMWESGDGSGRCGGLGVRTGERSQLGSVAVLFFGRGV